MYGIAFCSNTLILPNTLIRKMALKESILLTRQNLDQLPSVFEYFVNKPILIDRVFTHFILSAAIPNKVLSCIPTLAINYYVGI